MAELVKAWRMWLSLIAWLSLGQTALSLTSLLSSVAFEEPLGRPTSGHGPEILPQFTSHILVEGIGPYTFPTTHGILTYDAHSKRYSMRAHFEFPAFDHAKMRMQRVGIANVDVMKLQEVCMNWTFPGSGFDSLLEQFVQHANFTGRSQAELHALCGGHAGLTALLLWAPWHPASAHLTKVLDALARDHPRFRFGKVNVDVCNSIANALGASQVPFMAFLDSQGNAVEKLPGATPPKLVEKVKVLETKAVSTAAGGGNGATHASSGDAAHDETDLQSQLKKLIHYSPVMVFMKGSRAEPFCKFSKQLIAILDKQDVEYSTFDILQDEAVRQGLKEYSNWPTYPQVYLHGELLGGVDIIDEMDKEGSLKAALTNSEGSTEDETIEMRLRTLINREHVMVFMKGNPEAPRCGFSGKLVQLLNAHSVEFGHFDILSDEEVRQSLKSYSNWPTYPQVYSKGKLIGGLDIIKELAEEGSLEEELKGESQ